MAGARRQVVSVVSVAVFVGGGDEAKVEPLVDVHVGGPHALEERPPVDEGWGRAECSHSIVADDVVEVTFGHWGLEVIFIIVVVVVVVAAPLGWHGDVRGPVDVERRVTPERVPVGRGTLVTADGGVVMVLDGRCSARCGGCVGAEG